jgi:hypothetical protein
VQVNLGLQLHNGRLVKWHNIQLQVDMEFSIDIHTALTGEIIVEDFSKEYG